MMSEFRNFYRPKYRFLMALSRVVSMGNQMPVLPYIVFANWSYRQILLNWLHFAKRCGIENVIVVSYDKRLMRMLRLLGVQSVWLPMKQGKDFLWWRLYVFEVLCRQGIDFIHCDADAIILRNPEKELERYPKADLVASPGTVHPRTIAEKYHFVACMGYFLLRSTPATRSMLVEALSLVGIAGNDQASVNMAVFRHVTRWRHSEGDRETKTHLGTEFILNREAIRSLESDGLEVVILPHTLFQRYYSGHDHNPYLIHPLANQKAETKIDSLKRLGLWDPKIEG
jgi:hypothetical protein